MKFDVKKKQLRI